MLRHYGHRQAEREQGPNAERVAPLAERGIRVRDIWRYAGRP